MLGSDEVSPVGVLDGDELGFDDVDGDELVDGEEDGDELVDGDEDGDVLADGEVLGDGDAVCTAAPWSVSRSNLVTLVETPKVYDAQICAGKPPPLTRPASEVRPFVAPVSGTWGCGAFADSPKRPTEVTRSGV